MKKTDENLATNATSSLAHTHTPKERFAKWPVYRSQQRINDNHPQPAHHHLTPNNVQERVLCVLVCLSRMRTPFDALPTLAGFTYIGFFVVFQTYVGQLESVRQIGSCPPDIGRLNVVALKFRENCWASRCCLNK